MRDREHVRQRDGGQVVPLVFAIGMVTLLLAIGVGGFGASMVRHQRARQAADAAALAGASGGRIAAARLATANGAVLQRFAVVQVPLSDAPPASGVEVTVCLDGACAVARALP